MIDSLKLPYQRSLRNCLVFRSVIMADLTPQQPVDSKDKGTPVQAVLDDRSSQKSLQGPLPPVLKQKAPWWSWIWDYDPSRSKEEVKFIQRLDWGVMTILCLGYFVKNVHTSNMSNAFVSGMREELAMDGNELNLVGMLFAVNSSTLTRCTGRHHLDRWIRDRPSPFTDRPDTSPPKLLDLSLPVPLDSSDLRTSRREKRQPAHRNPVLYWPH